MDRQGCAETVLGLITQSFLALMATFPLNDMKHQWWFSSKWEKSSDFHCNRICNDTNFAVGFLIEDTCLVFGILTLWWVEFLSFLQQPCFWFCRFKLKYYCVQTFQMELFDVSTAKLSRLMWADPKQPEKLLKKKENRKFGGGGREEKS